jgi:thiosulfate sulfurtransferase
LYEDKVGAASKRGASEKGRPMDQIPEINIQDAKNKLEGMECTFVDIRDPASFREAHIPGAVHLHDGNVQQFVEAADKDSPFVVYCYHGNSSLGAVAFFLDNGFKNVVSMNGGFEAWREVFEYEPSR